MHCTSVIYYPRFSAIKFIAVIYSNFMFKILSKLNYIFPQGMVFKQLICDKIPRALVPRRISFCYCSHCKAA